MTPELVEEYHSDDGDREATISIADINMSMFRYTYEIIFASDGKIVGKHHTELLEAARVIAKRWVKKGELVEWN